MILYITNIIIMGPVILSVLSSIFSRYLGKNIVKYILLNQTIYNIISIYLFIKVYWCATDYYISLGTHLELSSMIINYNYSIDKNSVGMLVLINIITTIIYIYSSWYLEGIPHKTRYYTYLSCFYTSMIILVLSNNIWILFYGWEYVGLFSFLLINFWFFRYQANKAAYKAMFLNRIGDYGYYLLLIIWLNFSLESIDQIFNNSLYYFFLSLAIFAKSALHPFHLWLTSAMEGPTPISALLHAATMVSAGVYLFIYFDLNTLLLPFESYLFLPTPPLIPPLTPP